MEYIIVAILGCILFGSGVMLGNYSTGKKALIQISEYKNLADKYHMWIRLYDIWMTVKKDQKSIETYLLQKGCHKIAIYGMSYLGIRLFYELKDSSINVACGLDRNPRIKVVGLEVKSPDEAKMNEVDTVIVTALSTYDEIKRFLESKGCKNVIAFDELLYDLLRS